MHYHIGLYFQGGVSQLEKYAPYRNWTMDYKGRFSRDLPYTTPNDSGNSTFVVVLLLIVGKVNLVLIKVFYPR